MTKTMTPLEALRLNPNAITDAVYGDDHPVRGKKARKAPPQESVAAVRGHRTLLGESLDPNLKTRLNALRWKLEQAEKRMNTRKGA